MAKASKDEKEDTPDQFLAFFWIENLNTANPVRAYGDTPLLDNLVILTGERNPKMYLQENFRSLTCVRDDTEHMKNLVPSCFCGRTNTLSSKFFLQAGKEMSQVLIVAFPVFTRGGFSEKGTQFVRTDALVNQIKHFQYVITLKIVSDS